MRLPWECHDQSQETYWRDYVTGPDLPQFHKRKGTLKIDRSVKLAWHRLSMGVTCSYSSAPVRDWKSAFHVFCCFITGICVFFWLTTYYRHGFNLVLFTTKQLDSKVILSGIGSIPAWDWGPVCHSVQEGGKSLKWSDIRDQYPQDIAIPAGLKNDVNSMRSIECKYLFQRYCVLYLRCIIMGHKKYGFPLCDVLRSWL